MSSFGKQVIRSLKDFLAKAKRGEPVEATEVRRYQTPDGPMHVRTKKMMKLGKESK